MHTRAALVSLEELLKIHLSPQALLRTQTGGVQEDDAAHLGDVK
jgi:hypothetical protein